MSGAPSGRSSSRTAAAVMIGTVAVAVVACMTNDASLTSLTGGYITTLIGILAVRHASADGSGKKNE